jgi:hypothetical protein
MGLDSRDSDRWRAEPLWALRVGLKPGGDFKSQPKRLHWVERYGYDAAERLRVAQRYEDGRVQATVVAGEADDVSTRWEFDRLGSLEGVIRAELDPSTGRVLSSHLMSRLGATDVHVAKRFSYDEAGRLCRVRFEREGGDYESWPALRSGEQHISYGPDGNPVRVVERYDDPSAEPHVIYERLEDSWEALVEAVREPLVQVIAADCGLELRRAGDGRALLPECRCGRAAAGRLRVLHGPARRADRGMGL